MRLACLGIEAMKQSAEVGDVENPIANRNGADRAVHRFFKIDFAVAVAVDFAEMPHHGGIRIGSREIPFLGHHGLQSLVGDGFLGIGFVEGEFSAYIAAFRGIDAPQVPHPLAMLRVFAHADVNQPIVNHGSGNDVIARRAVQAVVRFLRIGVELPEQFRFAVFALGIEAINPAITTGENDLGLAVEHTISRRRPLAV